MIRLAIAMSSLAAAACSTATVVPHDGAGGDGAADDASIDGPAGDAAPAYRHTIAIDGSDDFVASEMFATTTGGYTARVTWDADRVYVGYAGADFDPAAAGASTKWLFVYLDVDPGAATGATISKLYRTQQAQFPPGFGAEYYLRRKCDGTLTSLEHHQTGTWTTAATAPVEARSGTFVELSIPRSALGAGTKLGIAAWMINEQDGLESSYGGLYPGSFTDGYATSVPIAKYLRADFTGTRPPNDRANQIP